MSQEFSRKPTSGWIMLALDFVLIAFFLFILFGLLQMANVPDGDPLGKMLGMGGAVLLLADIIAFILVTAGFLILQPGEACVLLLFGRYVGSAKESGFFWVNPFYTKRKISLRLRNLNGEKIKVNDKAGNPIEIAAVLVWKVSDTYAASFAVEDYERYVTIQSESALRHLANEYPYDSWESEERAEVTLRGNVDRISKTMEDELRQRLQKAGVEIVEARLSHLAYSPEIAEAMLRRQQATAVVSARYKIVEGAVGMVRLALDQLSKDQVVTLDEERKAAMVSNLLVVLCGEHSAQPVVNTGTLYQ